ncbi:golgin subfamily A member 2 [Copidosoma floridanum]|uniref:golgin subfamily A member 2 n=1 Tax=Copidosoma floridanum TaxID=29053 RepID=UPI0006C94E4E|nr:golgin subfamily A member 2 [Copidosoma floridanum]
MDKERILAARKKLKEFQRKKYQQAKNSSQSPSLENLQETQDAFRHIQQNLDSKDSNESIPSDTRSTTDSPSLYNSADFVKNVSPADIQDSTSIQKLDQDYASVNGSTDIPLFNSFTPAHSRNESTSTVSSQITHDNVDYSSQIDNLNLGLNIQSSHSSSLQKEQLLQMANTVANILVDEKRLDESTLNHCDLEQKNQFLTTCLEEQKKLVNQLDIQLSQNHNRISELEAIISTKNAEYENRLIREINPLKEQIQIDAQTIGILVGEKAELTAANSQNQIIIKQKTEEVMDLYGKLKNSDQRVAELEQELAVAKSNLDDFSKSYQQLQSNYEEVVDKSAKLKKENEDFELEISELRQNLSFKNTELSSLQEELQEKIALLQLSELRVKQMANSPQEVQSLESQHYATKILEQQLSQMREALESVNGEKDEVSKKYQSYVQQLDERYNKVLAELESSRKTINDSEVREQSYIQRLSDLEQQLQREKNKPIKPIEDQTEKIDLLTKSMDNLVLEQENLQSLLNEKDNEIELLKKELQEFQNVREQSLEATKLAQALQSEQLGASRAVAQNQLLKNQLEEMQDAFSNLIDTKLDLTEKLQAERSIGKKLNAELNDMEQQIEQLKEQLAKKEIALIDLEKEKLQAAQIEDQMQHYQAQSHNAPTLQQALQNSLITIENLKKENQVLQSKLQAVENSHTENVKVLQERIEIVSENCSSNSEENDSNDQISKNQSVKSKISAIPIISDPIKKLEARFKDTMEKVAELTDEKQRLEHIILQLQGETETIGEYVTLYQRQRAILKQKSRDRENTFAVLLEQRNQQQEQLHKLKLLVADLLKSKNTSATVPTAIAAEENMPLSNNSESESNAIEVIEGNANNQTDPTTSKILDLLAEIKDCNTCILEPNFHPCPWCSGKLITV